MPRQMPIDQPIEQESALLLGMVFAHTAIEPKRGQEFRDRVRCEAVHKLGYQVYTLDDKHGDIDIEEHCDANFADPRRMIKKMKSKWTDNIKFNHVILDYFFSPVGWARTRWTQRFFYKTIPAFVQEGILSTGGKLWLPHLDCITKEIEEYSEIIQAYYKIELVDKCEENPLYRATEDVTEELLRCPDNLTNATQVQPLWNHSKFPFVLLSVRDEKSRNLPLSQREKLPWVTLQTGKKLSTPVPYDSSTPSSTPVKNRRRPVTSNTATATQKVVKRSRGVSSSSGSGSTDEDVETSSTDDLFEAPLKTTTDVTDRKPHNAKRKRVA